MNSHLRKEATRVSDGMPGNVLLVFVPPPGRQVKQLQSLACRAGLSNPPQTGSTTSAKATVVHR